MATKNEIMSALKDTISQMFDEKIKRIPYQYSKIGTVESFDGNLTKVRIGENIHSCQFLSGLNLQINDVVIVLFTNGNVLTKVILGKF